MARKAGRLSYRYARALMKALASDVQKDESIDVEQLESSVLSLRQISEIWKTSKELRHSLSNPSIPQVTQIVLLKNLISKLQMHDIVSSFVILIFEKRRITLLPEISEAFASLVDSHMNVIRVKISTARELLNEERREITSALINATNANPLIKWEVTPEIFGGIVIRYKGKVLDASVSTSLNVIEERLLRQDDLRQDETLS